MTEIARGGRWAGHRRTFYVYGEIARYLNGISPTDGDMWIERNWCFLFFEGKTPGNEMPHGQALFFDRLVRSMAPGRAVLVVGEHWAADRVDPISDLLTFRWSWSDGGDELRQSGRVAGERMKPLVKLWDRDAARGQLSCAEWESELVATPGFV